MPAAMKIYSDAMRNYVLFTEGERVVAGEMPCMPGAREEMPKRVEYNGETYSVLGQVDFFDHLIDVQNRVLGFDFVCVGDKAVERVLQTLVEHTVNAHFDGIAFRIYLSGKDEELICDSCQAFFGLVFGAQSRQEPIIVLPDCIDWAHETVGFDLKRENVPAGRWSFFVR